MNFTYFQQKEVIILSTRRDTKKFEQILRNPKVAVLIHDFPHLEQESGGHHGKSWSITLNGTCKVRIWYELMASSLFSCRHMTWNAKKVQVYG